jgi:transcriptional regulator with XRE-family HTH domain
MSEDQAPIVQRALLTAELRRLRAAAQLSQEDVARSLDWSLSKLIRIEGGTVGVSTTDLRAMLELYNVQDSVRVAEIIDLARNARQRGWWTSFKNVSDREYINYVGYEAGASEIRTANGLLVPALLQTEDYAWAITSEYIGESSEIVKDVVEMRLERQERLAARKKAPRQYYVIDEAVIRRRVGAPKNRDLMPSQLRHLLEMAHRPEVTIEVVAFDAGAHFGLKGPFSLLTFDGELGDVLYMESARRGDLTLADPASMPLITSYHEAFQKLREVSLGPDTSAQLIARVAEEMSSGSLAEHSGH